MLKKILLLCLLDLMVGSIIADEDDFKMTIDKIYIISYNKDLIKEPKVSLFQYNSTHQAINGSGYLLQDLGMDLKDEADIYEVVNNETRLMTSAKEIKVCEILTSGYPEIENMFKLGNFTKCPMKKGFYSMVNAIMDFTNVPPNIPRGTFLIDFFQFSGSVPIMHTKSYITVEDVPSKQAIA